jgi:hypothetical protein
MSTATLADLMAGQREDLRSRRPGPLPIVALLQRLRRVNARPALRFALAVLASITGFVNRHGIVLSACTVLVIASCTISLTIGLFTAAVSLFFLEARRR